MGRFQAEMAELGARSLRERQGREIERAIDQVKWPKSALDRWFRREWYRAAACRIRDDRATAALEKETSERLGRYQHTSGE